MGIRLTYTNGENLKKLRKGSEVHNSHPNDSPQKAYSHKSKNLAWIQGKETMELKELTQNEHLSKIKMTWYSIG